jgi:hypothetical protein
MKKKTTFFSTIKFKIQENDVVASLPNALAAHQQQQQQQH